MHKSMFVVSILAVAGLLLAACGGTPPVVMATPSAGATAPRVQIRWLTGTGSNPNQGTDIAQIIADFNASQDRIDLTLTNDSGSADIVGPVGWEGSNLFHGQYLDLSGLIAATGFDTSIFSEELLKLDQTGEGQMGLPFAAYPSAVYYVPALFDDAGLSHPPVESGQPYVMPDGSEKPWDWNTLADIARLLTLDGARRNATQSGFDRTRIVQFGFVPQWQTIVSLAGFWGADLTRYYDTGNLDAHIPVEAKQAWSWYYEGMWGDQPFIPTNALVNSADFGSGNAFNSGRVAMTVTPLWYTCCLTGLAGAGDEFQLAALPASPNNGRVYDRVEVDSFHIFKSSPHPNEAFDVIAYLTTTGALTQAGDVLPAIRDQQAAFFEAASGRYPFVTSWQPFTDGLTDPNILPAGGDLPNYTEAWARLMAFGDKLANSSGLDIAAETSSLEVDLSIIFKK